MRKVYETDQLFCKETLMPGIYNVYDKKEDLVNRKSKGDDKWLGVITMIYGIPYFNTDGEDVPVLLLKQIVEFMEKLNDKSSKQSQTSAVS